MATKPAAKAPAKKVEEKKPAAALVKKEEAPPPEAYAGLMDNEETVDAKDLLLPRILLMQGMSKFVADEKARQGEFRGSLECNLLGGKEQPLAFIPFKSHKVWVVFNVVEGQQIYSGTFPYGPDNANWEREEETEEGTIKRYQALNYYVLLPEDIEKGEAFPYVISFRSTSYTAGRKLETHKVKYKAIKKPLAWKTFHLTTTQQQNEKGKFYVFDVAPERLTTAEELAEVSNWKKLIEESNVRVDESDSSDFSAAATEEGGEASGASDDY